MGSDLIPRLTEAFRQSPVPGIVSAYLFGSHARHRAHEESDIDVGVLFSRACYPTDATRFDARIDLTAYLARTLMTGDVDIVGLGDAPPMLVRRVMTEGIRVLCNDSATDDAARRTALSRAADLEPFLRRMRRIKLNAMAR